MAPHPRSEQTKPVLQIGNIQDGNARNNQALPSGGGVGHILGFQRCLLPHSHQSKVEEVPWVSPKQTFQFTALPFGLATAPLEFTMVVKEVKLMAQSRGIRIHQYLDDLFTTYTNPIGPVPEPGVGSQSKEVGTSA